MNNALDKEKQLFLFLVSFAGHKTTIDSVREFLRYDNDNERGISDLFFLEYFLLNPLKLTDPFKAIIFCPYLERMIKEQRFLPDWDVIKQNIDKAIDDVGTCKIDLLPRTRELEKELLKDPLELSSTTGWAKFGNKIFSNWQEENRKLGEIKLNQGLESFSLDSFKEYVQKIRDIRGDKDLQETLLKETLITTYPWARNGVLNSGKIRMVGVPIASTKLFYGYLLCGLFQQENESEENIASIASICKRLHAKFIDQVKKFYLPALTLCHHSFYEKASFSNETIPDDMPFLFEELKDSKYMLEKKFYQLWSLRKKHWTKVRRIKDSHLIFIDRFWASPRTIRTLTEDAFTWDMDFGEETGNRRPKLKTFLIAGGPGSGKETLSKMIGLFSNGHTFSKPHIFNMASLKPDWVAPPSLVGIETQGTINYSLIGIFEKVLKKSIHNDENPIVILDELNSLDIGAQGTLLRVLENEEVVPICGIDEAIPKEKVSTLLIVGVVNELPPQLTLEDPISDFYQDRQRWGNLLGPVLYEYYRGMRRLRDDLFYRFTRGGYIELKDLDERREDIPIIFFTSLPAAQKKDIAERKMFIEYDVWELLTDKRIRWKGNVRQLQAVAHKIAKEILKDGKKKEINVPMVIKVLKDLKIFTCESVEDDSTASF